MELKYTLANYFQFEVVNKNWPQFLDFFQYRFSDSLGDNPPLYSCGLSTL